MLQCTGRGTIGITVISSHMYVFQSAMFHFEIAYFTLAQEDLAYFTLCSRGTLFCIDAYSTLEEEEEEQAEEDVAQFTLVEEQYLLKQFEYSTLAEEEEQQADLIIFPSPSGPLGEACHFSTLPSHDHDDDHDDDNYDEDNDDDESGDMMVKDMMKRIFKIVMMMKNLTILS